VGAGAGAGAGAAHAADALYLCILAYIHIIYAQVGFVFRSVPQETYQALNHCQAVL
jgi:hypothetical protein